MTPLASEWVAKAEGDFGTASRELAVTAAPNYDAVCFHGQQCAEKYLKAALAERGLPIPRTHDLPALLALLATAGVALSGLAAPCGALSDAAVEVRYPGMFAAAEDAVAALADATAVRTAVRQYLNLTV